MLEMLVDLCRSYCGCSLEIGGAEGLPSERQAGDILCVKRTPAIWSDKERALYLITYFDMPELEWSMGESDLRAFPFAVRETFSNVTVTVCLSPFIVDLDMFEGSPGLDPEVPCGAVFPNGGSEALTQDQLPVKEIY